MPMTEEQKRAYRKAYQERKREDERIRALIPSPSTLPSAPISNLVPAEMAMATPIIPKSNLVPAEMPRGDAFAREMTLADQAEQNRMNARTRKLSSLDNAFGAEEQSLDLPFQKQETVDPFMKPLKKLSVDDLPTAEEYNEPKKNNVSMDKVDKWLDPNYQLSKEEKKEAQETAESFFSRYGLEHAPMKDIYKYAAEHPEFNEEYEKMKKLTLKATTLGNFGSGFKSAFTDVASGLADMAIGKTKDNVDKYAGLVSSVTGVPEEEVRNTIGNTYEQVAEKKQDIFNPIETEKENAKTQNSLAYGAGNLGGKALQYIATEPLFAGAAASAGLGKGGAFVANQVGQNAQDLALDTLPSYFEMQRQGLSDEEIGKELAKNVGVNAGLNLGLGVLGEIPGLIKNAKNAKQLPQLDEAAKMQEYYNSQANPTIERQLLDELNASDRRIAEEAAALEQPKIPQDMLEQARAEQAMQRRIAEEAEAVRESRLTSDMIPQETPIEAPKVETPVETPRVEAPRALERPLDLDDMRVLQQYGAEFENRLKGANASPEFKKAYNDFWEYIVNSGNGTNTLDRAAVEEALRRTAPEGADVDGFLRSVGEQIDSDGLKFATDVEHTMKELTEAEQKAIEGRTFRELAQEELERVKDGFTYNKRFVRDMEMAARGNDDLMKAVEEVKAAHNAYYDAALNGDKNLIERLSKDFNNAVGRASRKFEKEGIKGFSTSRKLASTFDDPKRVIMGAQTRSEEELARNLDILNDVDESNRYARPANELPKEKSVALAAKNGDSTYMGTKKFSEIMGSDGLKNAEKEIPTMKAAEEAPGMKTSGAYTNTASRGGGWNKEEYKNYTDPKHYQYESIDEVQSVERAEKMRAEEGREAFKNRVLDAEKVSSVEIDGLMMEWRETVEEARALEEAGKDASSLWEESNRIFKKVQEQSTHNAQALQALAKWSRNTPEGLLMRAENIINKKTELQGASELKKQFDKWAKRNAKDIEFTPDFQKEFLKEAKKLDGLDIDSREAKDIMANLGKMVYSQVPVKLNEKLQSFLMDNMLGNFRTLITRNAGGNLGLAMTEQFAQRPLAAGLDKLVAKTTGRRTQAGMTAQGLKEYFSGMKKGLSDELHDVRTGLHTARSGENTLERAITSNRHVFKTKVADKLDAAVKHGLSVGDRPFYEAIYKQTLGDYQRLRETGQMGEVIQKLSDDDFKTYAETAAKMNALAAVYQNDSALSNAFMGLKNSIGEMSQGLIGVDVLSQFSMPFVKTPANVVDRAIDYSPLGFARNAFRTAKEGGIKGANFDQNRFVNETARNIIGTGIVGGASVGAANGLLSGGYSDNKNAKEAQRNAGMQEYALNLPGDRQMDISWIPILGDNAVAAAAAYDAFQNGDGNAVQNILGAAGEYGKSLFSDSMFQGMQRLFGGDSYNSGNGIIGNMGETVKSGISQVIPSIVRQAAQVTDEYKRDLTNSGDRDYAINSLMSAIPGVRETLAPKVDQSGNLVEENQGRSIGSKILKDMILPGRVTKVEQNPLDLEAERLSEITKNDTSYMPKAYKDDITTEDHSPTDDEWVAYQQDYGHRMSEAGETLINSDAYKGYDDLTKEKALSDVYSAVRNAVKAEYTGKEVGGAEKAYLEGGTDGVIQYVEDRITLTEMGLQNNEANRKLLHEGGVEAIKEKQAINDAGLAYNDANKELYKQGGIEAVQERADLKETLKSAGISMTEKTTEFIDSHPGSENYIPTLADAGLKGLSVWHAYDKAKSSGVSPQTFANTYKTIDADGNSSIKQSELTAYLNTIKASAEQAQEIAGIYGGDWKGTLKKNKKGAWTYK